MDNTDRPRLGQQVSALEARAETAEQRLAALAQVCQSVIIGLSSALDALSDPVSPDAPEAPETQHAAPVDAQPVAEPRRTGEEAEAYRKATDTAVLSVLTEHAGTEVRVAAIAKQLREEGLDRTDREVSLSLQRLRNSVEVDVRPAVKKGYWYRIVVPTTAENGTPTAAEPGAETVPSKPEPSAVPPLEESGVVASDPWPYPDEYTRL